LNKTIHIITLFSLIFCSSCLYKKHPVTTTISAISPNDLNISIDSLANQLLLQISLKEKVDQMTGEKNLAGLIKLGSNFLILKRFPHLYSGKNKRLGIPPFSFSDGPRGATVGGHKNTIFPVAMARGASWNRKLEASVADIIGKEIRANGGNYTGTPCINLLRHPAWGRAQETYGEDPYLLGELGLAYVQSIQQHHVMACPKHFALNSIENARFYVDVQLKERTLREVYLPHFKKVIQKGQAASIMSAYNKMRGEWCGENKYLLNDILREEWSFKGFVSSDWVWGLHEAANGIKAGMDVEMPVKIKYKLGKVKKALKDGNITVKDIDKMVLRILKTKLKFALAKDKIDYHKKLKGHPQHIALAQQVAEESMVLLKNNKVLPFQLNKGERIAVIGRLANIKNTGDHGSSGLRNKDVVTAFEGINKYVSNLGATAVLDNGANLEKAKALAQQTEKVVLVVGYDFKDEGEYLINKADNEAANLKKANKKGKGGDRQSLELKPGEVQLIQEVSAVNPNTVVVYIGGSAIVLESWKAKAPAILFSWYAGMRGGDALANILFGQSNPSGKLPFTIPKKSSDLPPFNSFADTAFYGYYHGYSLMDKKEIAPSFPFGFGLSYTSFRIENLEIHSSSIGKSDTLSLSIDLTNTGKIAGAEVCQVYIGFQNSKLDRPIKLLRGFEKVFLEPNEKCSLTFNIKASDLAYYDTNEKKWAIETMEYELYIGNSSHSSALLKNNFTIKN